jgi:hypothetical protein
MYVAQVWEPKLATKDEKRLLRRLSRFLNAEADD